MGIDFVTYGLEEARKYDAGDTSVIAGTQLEELIDRFKRQNGGDTVDMVYVVEAFVPGCMNDYVESFDTLEDAIKDRNEVALGWYGPETYVCNRFAGSWSDWTGDLAAKQREDSYSGYAVQVSVGLRDNYVDPEDTFELTDEGEALRSDFTEDEYDAMYEAGEIAER